MDRVVKRQNTCNANAPSRYSTFASVDDNLLIEILCRLPCKDAHQFKCVCKLWFSVISDSYFIERFLSTHPQPSPFALWIKYHDVNKGREMLKLLFTSKDSEFQSQEFSLNFLPCFKSNKRNQVNIIASCNGLLLCCAATEACLTVYYICNPLTKQWFALPPVYHHNQEAYTGLICENKSNQYGYRVVCIVRYTRHSAVKIFSSETGSWKETIYRHQAGDFSPWLNNQAIVCKGMLHWWSPSHRGLVTFDPFNKDGNLKFSFEHYPADLNFNFKAYLGVCKGSFCLGQLSSDNLSENDSATLRIWQLADCDGGKWWLKHKVPMNEVKSEVTQLAEYAEFSALLLIFQFLSFHPYNENIIYMSGLHCVVSCNIETKTLEMVSENSFNILAYPFEFPRWPSPIPSSIDLSEAHVTSV